MSQQDKTFRGNWKSAIRNENSGYQLISSNIVYNREVQVSCMKNDLANQVCRYTVNIERKSRLNSYTSTRHQFYRCGAFDTSQNFEMRVITNM